MLTETNLCNLDYNLLYLARNEIFARHGYVFKIEYLKKYFEIRSWYKKNSKFDGNLSSIENKNVNLIKSFESYQKNYTNSCNINKQRKLTAKHTAFSILKLIDQSKAVA